MDIQICHFPAGVGLSLQYNCTVNDNYGAAISGMETTVLSHTVSPADWSGTLSDGDVVWVTPSGLVHVPGVTDENGEIVQGDKPGETFETGECYWVLARIGDVVLRLEVV